MKSKAAGLVAVLIMAGCGGGGSESGSASPAPVAAAPTAPEPASGTPAAAPAPAPASPGTPPGASPAAPPSATGPVPGVAPAPTPGTAPAPGAGTDPAASAPSAFVSGASVVKAITSGYRARFTSADPGDVNFSFVSNALVGSRLYNESSLTAFSDPYYMKTVVISLDAAAATGALTFNGSGNLSLQGVDSGYAELSAGQYSIPAQVPLNTPGLHEWSAPGGNAVVRLNVGGVEGHPEQMRVCWDIEAFGISRATCTRHLRSDGTVVGADSVNRAGATTFAHETNDDAASPRRVHACVYTRGLYGPGMEPQITETRSFSLFEFFPPRLLRNRTIVRDFVQGPNDPSIAGHLVTDLGNGLTQERLYNPRSGTTITRRANAIEAFEYGFGAPGGQQTESEQCSATEGL